MKVTLTFEFDLPQDSGTMQATIKGRDLLSRLRELDAELRLKLKHAEMTDDAYAAYSDVRRKLNDLVDDAGLKDVD